MSNICASQDKGAVGPGISMTPLAVAMKGLKDGQTAPGRSFVLTPLACSQARAEQAGPSADTGSL